MEAIIKEILREIEELQKQKKCVLVGIDGRCAAGKTTLASELQKVCDANVIHVDSFFLRPVQRTPERESEPGGNVDYERFRTEVSEPLKKGIPFFYKPYDCHRGDFAEEIRVEPKPVCIIEGAYAFHPKLDLAYDLELFLDVDRDKQLKRIAERNGREAVKIFSEKWIPMEERYFDEFCVENVKAIGKRYRI